jgi:ankyrin repeat protein
MMILYIFGINSETIMRSGILLILVYLVCYTAGFSQVRESTDTTTIEDPAALPVTLSDTLIEEERADTLEAVPADQPLQPMEGIGEYRVTVQLDTAASLEGDREFNLIRAADRGQLKIVKFLVERGVDVDARSVEGVTPLMYASQNGYLEIMEYLIRMGADVNATPYNNVTPLIGAVRTGHFEATELLLEAGAKVDAKDELGLTSLMHASAYDYPEIADLLIGKGANLEAGDWFGTRPLMMAVYYDCYESAQVLVRRGADLNAQDTFGFTALMIAAQHADYDMAWLLLDRGADPRMQNKGGLHAIAMATISGDEDIIELLLENGAGVNQNISYSTNALSLAREAKSGKMEAFLLENKAHKNRIPEISEIRIEMGLDFSADDLMVGGEIGVSENKYNMFATTGFFARTKAVTVIRPENDTLSYQFWERRYFWPLTVGKNFTFYRNQPKSAGFKAQLRTGITWGGYRGSDLHPGTRFILVPSAGLYWRDKFWGLSFDYEYVNYKAHELSPHRFRLSLLVFINLQKRMKYTRKHISWF